MANCHITRQSVLTGQTMYYKGDNHWSESFDDRKIYSTLTEARGIIAPTTRRIGDKDIANANGTFKNASVVNE